MVKKTIYSAIRLVDTDELWTCSFTVGVSVVNISLLRGDVKSMLLAGMMLMVPEMYNFMWISERDAW